MSTSQELLLAKLQRLKYERELREKEFPLRYLLTLYSHSHRALYLEYFQGMKELITWLSPISRSTKQIVSIPTYLLTYEMQEIARYTGNHITQIYQELTDIWTLDSNR